MRLRNILAAAVVGAAALVLVAPASADAADGAFTYLYNAPDGSRQLGLLTDPPSGTCMTLPEVSSPALPPADTPLNHTDVPVLVFTGPSCDGAAFLLRASGGHGSEGLALRSVMFG